MGNRVMKHLLIIYEGVHYNLAMTVDTCDLLLLKTIIRRKI